MPIENVNLSGLTSGGFRELLRRTYFKGAVEVYEKQKEEDMRIKEMILTAILDAAREGKTSTSVRLDSYLSKNNENFLRSAHIDWEASPSDKGLLLNPFEYTFYWENLKDELVFDEED